MVQFRRTLLLTILLFLINVISSIRDIKCHDPDVGGTTQNKSRKFILFGTDATDGSGIGNLLIFFPSIYYFAAFTGRDILILDSSIIGEMCKVVTCGFPFASEMALAYPTILAPHLLTRLETAKVGDFKKYIEGTKDFAANVIIGFGYKSVSDWYSWYNVTANCVQKLTGCELGDIGCSDRHAYQRLVRGPFKVALTEEEERRIMGVPVHIKHAILSLPHAFAPRLDAAVHLRNSFKNFEIGANISDIGYKKEVSDWLNSTQCSVVFEALKSKLIGSIEDNRINLNSTESDDVYVYLAADNERVKEAFAATLLSNETHGTTNFSINVMRVDTKFVHHIKNLAEMKAVTNNEGILDIVFDWYALTLANTVIAWRKDFTPHVSTFVHSAQRVSGTTERTVITAPIGHGIGTQGFHMTMDRYQRVRWNSMWSYSIIVLDRK